MRVPLSPRCTTLSTASCGNHGAAPNFGTRVPGNLGGKKVAFWGYESYGQYVTNDGPALDRLVRVALCPFIYRAGSQAQAVIVRDSEAPASGPRPFAGCSPPALRVECPRHEETSRRPFKYRSEAGQVYHETTLVRRKALELADRSDIERRPIGRRQCTVAGYWRC